MSLFEVSQTPNPDSLKFSSTTAPILDVGGMESFNSAAEAAGHPLGRALFAIDGVANVFILPAFLTVTKRPDADWDALLPLIQDVLHAHQAHS